ncbi:hypothetical protein [Rhizobium halophytocola]|uniref:Uncharacterized protein n=1 Tax=Rhizobium halophytocola TaxID=735519 RepID=A0ABS4DYS6_9HYPH|nr:hypothetical protein [Rhizobium halophytocola]MBP1850843.1 hypothetical protein [Rhizobium halophytocola]
MLNWLLIFEASTRVRAGGRPQSADPLADPLERAEWQGLDWVVRGLNRLDRVINRANRQRAVRAEPADAATGTSAGRICAPEHADTGAR